MTVVHLLVPGLGRGHVDGALGAGVLRRHPPTRRADLVVSFPARIADVERTLLEGRDARARGVLVDATLPAGPAPIAGHATTSGILTVIERGEDWDPSTASPVSHLLWTDLAQARVGHGPGSNEEIEALARLDAALESMLTKADRVVVSGAPTLAPVSRRVELGAPDRSLRTEGALAWFAGSAAPAERDRWLSLPGVERVLTGEGLDSWGAPGGVYTVIVAEPGWSFEAGRAAAGHADVVDAATSPVVLAFGARAADWPRAVHDYRIGPTLVVAAGLTPGPTEDAPLPW